MPLVAYCFPLKHFLTIQQHVSSHLQSTHYHLKRLSLLKYVTSNTIFIVSSCHHQDKMTQARPFFFSIVSSPIATSNGIHSTTCNFLRLTDNCVSGNGCPTPCITTTGIQGLIDRVLQFSERLICLSGTRRAFFGSLSSYFIVALSPASSIYFHRNV